jgi:hypothetical protein
MINIAQTDPVTSARLYLRWDCTLIADARCFEDKLRSQPVWRFESSPPLDLPPARRTVRSKSRPQRVPMIADVRRLLLQSFLPRNATDKTAGRAYSFPGLFVGRGGLFPERPPLQGCRAFQGLLRSAERILQRLIEASPLFAVSFWRGLFHGTDSLQSHANGVLNDRTRSPAKRRGQ